MTRRLRTDRMRFHAAAVQESRLLRESIADVMRKLREGDLTINGARKAMGLTPFGPLGGQSARARPDDLPGALAWYGLDDITGEQIAEWQARWDEVMAADQPHRQRLIVLPSRTVIRSERPRKSTPRGLPRMRAHTRSLLLNALRGDGTPRGAARIAICRAYRVLPDEIGVSHVGRIADGIRSADEIRAECAQHAQADLGIITAELSFGLPEGLEFVVSEDPRGAQIELAHPTSPWIDPNGDPTE